VSRVIGIDLGTTNSCVGALVRGQPTVIATADGQRTTPSVVAFQPDGRVLVGAAARRQAVTSPRRTIFATKRLIGRKVNSPEVSRFARSAPFLITAAPNGDAWVALDEGPVSPQEIAAHILERMRAIAEEQLGEPVTQAVIAVPAYFNDAQRQATRDAGRIAGLDVRRILNEPTAAALAYGVHRRKDRQRLAVFDLGGGTFDVSILHVASGIFEVLAVAGDTALGGNDFDERITLRLLADIADADASTEDDPVALGRLREESERAKRTLSEDSTVRIHLPFIARRPSGEPWNLERTLTRAELEALTADLIERLRAPCETALRDAGLAASDLDDVLLVGGMTRAPAVASAVERIFGRRPSRGAHPDEVVALGAAAHGALLAGELEDALLLDVLPQSLGVRVGENVAVVLPRNSTIPARARKVFATTKDDQAFVTLEVYQGDARAARDNRYLGRFTLDRLPRGPAGTVRIEVSFTVDVDGIVSLAAREPLSGVAASSTLSPSGGLSPEDLDRIIEARRAAARERG
jgi:molecular chaperone DnaK